MTVTKREHGPTAMTDSGLLVGGRRSPAVAGRGLLGGDFREVAAGGQLVRVGADLGHPHVANEPDLARAEDLRKLEAAKWVVGLSMPRL